METYNSRLVFLDSTNNSTGTGINASFPVNDTDNFTAQGNNKTMRVGLNSFSMYRNFYNVNPTNNTFFVGRKVAPAFGGEWEWSVGKIAVGDYSHFTYDASCNCNNPEIWATYLDEAIAEAVVEALGGVVPYTAGKRSTNTYGTVQCIYNTKLRIFQIYFDDSLFGVGRPTDYQLYFMTVKNSNQTAKDKTWFKDIVTGQSFLTATDLFQDTYQIMGGQTNYSGSLNENEQTGPGSPPIIATNTLNPGYERLPIDPNTILMPVQSAPGPNYAGNALLLGFSVAQLSTLDELVIRTNMPSQNYQSPGVDQTIPTNLGLSPTNILARIPIDDTTFDEKRGIIHFIDHNNNFYLMLGSNTLTNIRLILTDGRGRELFTLGEDAQQSANMNFRASLKIDYIILPDEREKLLLNADRMSLYPINIGRG